jgi:hypothetical protein
MSGIETGILVTSIAAGYLAILWGFSLYTSRQSRRKRMRVKYRIQVGDQACEVDSDFMMLTTIKDLVNGRSKLQKNAVRPEDIHITVHEADPEPEPAQWHKVESK